MWHNAVCTVLARTPSSARFHLNSLISLISFSINIYGMLRDARGELPSSSFTTQFGCATLHSYFAAALVLLLLFAHFLLLLLRGPIVVSLQFIMASTLDNNECVGYATYAHVYGFIVNEFINGEKEKTAAMLCILRFNFVGLRFTLLLSSSWSFLATRIISQTINSSLIE